jgi:hypothetical protein
MIARQAACSVGRLRLTERGIRTSAGSEPPVMHRRSIIRMSDSGFSRTAARERPWSTGRRLARWTCEEVLEQVARAGADAEAVARSVVGWAVGHSNVGVKGGRCTVDRSLTMYADSGRGKGVLCLYAAENGGGRKGHRDIHGFAWAVPVVYDSSRAAAQIDQVIQQL